MIEQRLQQRLRLLLAAPAAIVLLVAALAVTTARAPGVQPREAVFDLFSRLSPRPAAAPRAAVIDIDEESTQRLGPWPWPRTALAELVTAAEEAGASSVVLAVPVEGPDPLSPEVVGRYWLDGQRGDQAAARAVAALPSNDVALAGAASGLPTGLGVARAVPATDRSPSWVRADAAPVSWLSFTGREGTGREGGGFLALPAATPRAPLSAGLSAAGTPVVIGLPADADGVVRRTPLLWAVDGQPTPAAGAAPLAFGGQVLVAPRRGSLRVGGTPPAALGAGDAVLPLDHRAEARLWWPADTDVATVPAWRALTGGAQWTRQLSGKIVIIGATAAAEAPVSTARGPMTLAQAHALLADQALAGSVPVRPGWAGPAEAFAALLFGALAVAAAVFAPALIAALFTLLIAVAGGVAAYVVFRGTGLLIDPVPLAAAMAGGQSGVVAMVLGDMMLRDDAVRGAFHGALPPATMTKVQSRGGAALLRGVRRDVTVLSCSLRLPARVVARFESRPDDFVRFQASANDALRRAILAHEGTVDAGENGQLLGYWNVPEGSANHIEHACACALRMVDDVVALSENVQAAALSGEASVDAGFADGMLEIGLASGPAFAGPVGIGSRNRYAVLGDPVSLATRLRARSPLYGPAIITDDRVFDALRHHYAFLDLDLVRLDGSDEVRGVYGLVGNPFLKASKAFRTLADTQRELLLSWKAGELDAVTRQLQRLRALPGVTEPYVALFEARLAEARARPRSPRESWHPETVLVI